MCASHFWELLQWSTVGGCACLLAFQKHLLQFLEMQLIEHCTFWKSKQKYVSNLSFGVGHWGRAEQICVCLVGENVSILSKYLGRLKMFAAVSHCCLAYLLKEFWKTMNCDGFHIKKKKKIQPKGLYECWLL